jgi:hypothetical protein
MLFVEDLGLFTCGKMCVLREASARALEVNAYHAIKTQKLLFISEP